MLPPLIPLPQKYTERPGVLKLNNIVLSYANLSPKHAFHWYSLLVNKLLQHDIDLFVDISTQDSQGKKPLRPCCKLNLFILLDKKIKLPEEGYRLSVDKEGITLSAPALSGLNHAVQTLLSLLCWAHLHNGGILPCLLIEDYPQYAWRGLHLDVSRHFFPVEFLRQYLDWMAELKLNRFHWHLTDDQGWRVESLLFPRLTSVGAWRTESDGSIYGGFYSQAEIKSLLAYAGLLGIEIVPEIDIPGHCLGILAAYPQLSCHGNVLQTWTKWGISEDILCAGKDETLSFLTSLFAEIASLFPGQFIHLGGDEAPKANWKACPACRKRMQDNALEDEEALQSWLFASLSRVLKGLHKEVIGWDEISDGTITPDPVVMVWRGDGYQAAKKASLNGNRYILCPNHFLYFDWKQKAGDGEPGAFGVTTLEQVYRFNPRSYEFATPSLLLGGQANVWTERMRSPAEVGYLLFPRAFALSEVFWSNPDHRNWDDFQSRLQFLPHQL